MESQAPTHIQFELDDIELTAPIGSGADHVIFDGNPGAETFRFNPKGIVVNKSKLKAVRLLTPAQMDETGIGADSVYNERRRARP